MRLFTLFTLYFAAVCAHQYKLLNSHNDLTENLYKYALLHGAAVESKDMVYMDAKILYKPHTIKFDCLMSFEEVHRTFASNISRFKIINSNHILFFPYRDELLHI